MHFSSCLILMFVQRVTHKAMHQPFWWSQVSYMALLLYPSHNRKPGPGDTCGTDRRPPKTGSPPSPKNLGNDLSTLAGGRPRCLPLSAHHPSGDHQPETFSSCSDPSFLECFPL